jgi:hypothetical protein
VRVLWTSLGEVLGGRARQRIGGDLLRDFQEGVARVRVGHLVSESSSVACGSIVVTLRGLEGRETRELH